MKLIKAKHLKRFLQSRQPKEPKLYRINKAKLDGQDTDLYNIDIYDPSVTSIYVPQPNLNILYIRTHNFTPADYTQIKVYGASPEVAPTQTGSRDYQSNIYSNTSRTTLNTSLNNLEIIVPKENEADNASWETRENGVDVTHWTKLPYHKIKYIESVLTYKGGIWYYESDKSGYMTPTMYADYNSGVTYEDSYVGAEITDIVIKDE